MTETLKIENLHVSVEDKPILHGVNMQIARGETHALMGPNGSGKSTLGLAVMGHPGYQVTQGEIELAGEMIGELAPDERARRGLFMAFQRPMAIPGVKMADFLRHATTNVRQPDRKEGEELIPMRQFRKELKDKMEQLKLEDSSQWRNDRRGRGSRFLLVNTRLHQPSQPTQRQNRETFGGYDKDDLEL